MGVVDAANLLLATDRTASGNPTLPMYMLKSKYLVLQKVTVFGDTVFKEGIKLQ